MEGTNDEAPAVESKWTTIQTRSVKSEVARDPEWMDLTPLDISQGGRYSSFLFLYKPKSEVSDRENGDIVVLPSDRLIASLGKALVYFYPLAGRLVKNEDDDHARLYCNNEGALWIHKRYDGYVSDLIDEDDFKSNEDIAGTSDLQPGAQTFDLPALIVQVTEFQCGTISLSASYSHMVADGFSGLHFLKSWAETSRGEPISLVPVHDRSLLMPRKSSSVVNGQGDVKKKVPILGFITTLSTTSFQYPPCKTLRFSKRRIEELKNEAKKSNQPGNEHGRFPSTAECGSAHIWRRLVELQELEKHEMTSLISLVNARSRLKEFPAGYFGNCVVGAFASASTEDLLTNPLDYAGTLYRNALRRVDDEYVRNWVDVLGSGIAPYGSMVPNALNIMASWQHRFPFYELDFGSGVPAKSIQNVFRTPARGIGKLSAYPGSTAGELIITVVCSQSVLNKLCDEM